MRCRFVSVLPSLGALLATAACSNSSTFFPDHCNIQIARITPANPVLPAGDTLTLHAEYNDVSSDCIPPVPASSLRWSADNTATASIDSITGKITAHANGATSFSVHAPGSATNLGGVQVTVVSPH